jgi:hypothetical protein
MDRAPGPDTIVIPIGTADIEAITALVTTDVGTTALDTMDVGTTGIAGGAARAHE